MPESVKLPKISQLLPTTNVKTKSKCTLWISWIRKRKALWKISPHSVNYWTICPDILFLVSRLKISRKESRLNANVTQTIVMWRNLFNALCDCEWPRNEKLKSIYDCNSCANYQHSNGCGHRNVNWCLSSSWYENIRKISKSSNNRLITWKTFRLATYDSPKIGFFCSSSS